MRFSIWKKAVMLGVAALGSGSVLASGIVERAPVSSRAQAPSRASVKRIGTDAVQTKADAAAPSAESAPALHAPEGRALTLPHKQEETAPAGSSVPVALKVRG